MTKGKQKYYIVNKVDGQTAEILIYGDIFPYEGCVRASDFVADLMRLAKTCTLIKVRINSNGGDVFEGIAIFNAIRNCAVDCYTYIDGIAASMGSVIAMAGKKVFMSKYARLMAHKPSGGAWGNADELRRVADEIDDVEQILSDVYVSKTGLSKKQVGDQLLNGTDVYLNAAQAKKLKLVDDIYDGDQIDVPETITDLRDMVNIYHGHFAHKMESFDYAQDDNAGNNNENFLIVI